jgi:hypothetical protein
MSQGPGWWRASDGRWYPAEQHPDFTPPPPSPYSAPGSPYSAPGSPYAAPSSPYSAPSSPYSAPGFPYSAPGSPYSVPGYYGSGAAGPPRTSGMAIASFVCSLVGILLAGIPALVGIILGFVARHQIRRSGGTRSGSGLALAGIIVGFAEVALVVVLVLALVAVVRTDNAKVQIAGAPGYTTLAGTNGKSLPEGQPWGVACEPIVFQPAPGVPDSIYTQLQQVVLVARASGVDVTVATRQDRWYPDSLYPSGLTDSRVQFVTVSTSAQTPPLLGFDRPEHIQFSWDARLSGDGKHDVITYLQGQMYLQALTSPSIVRLAVRQLIAFSQGVAASSDSESGIVDGTTADAFTAKDISAMRLMSGCRNPPA